MSGRQTASGNRTQVSNLRAFAIVLGIFLFFVAFGTKAEPGAEPSKGKASQDACVPEDDTPERLSEQQLACIGEPYGPLIREVQEADPAADARREAEEGDFRFLRITGAWRGPMEPGIACAFDVPRALVRANLFYSDAINGEGDILHRRALTRYAKAYNRTIVSHKTFPYPDICRLRTDDETDWRPYRNLSDFRKAQLRNGKAETLHIAARSGNSDAVRRLLKRGSDPNEIDVWGFTPLGWAVLVGDDAIVAQLLENGANPDRHGDGRPTPLNLAINARSLPLVRRLVGAGADVKAESPAPRFLEFSREAPPGGTPLWAAVKLGELRIAKYLSEKGADPNVPNNYEQTPLFAAISNKRPDLVALLLSHGADVLVRDRTGISVIQAAAEQQHPESVRLVARAGGLADARSKAERSMWRAALDAGNHEILADLVAFGANIHLLKTPERRRLLTHILADEREAVLELLLQADRQSARLEEAVKQGDLSLVQQIYSGGAEIAEGRMRTGLIMAVEARQTRLLKWFLEMGADPQAPVHYANLTWLRRKPDGLSDKPQDRISAEMRIYQGGPHPHGTALTQVFEYGPIESVRLVLEKVKPPKQKTSPYWGSILHQAFFGFREHKDPQIIELAVKISEEIPKHGPRADAFLREVCFWTASSDTEVLKTWLERGYRPRQNDDPPPRTARYPGDDLAFNECLDQSAEAGLLMLRYGADPNQSSSIGYTPLWEALNEMYSEPEYLELIDALLRHGANPNQPDKYGRIVLDEVQRRLQHVKQDQLEQFSKAERLLLKHGAKTRAQLEKEGVLEPIPEPERAIPVR